MNSSDRPVSLQLTGERWRRERREVALWAAAPFLLGYGIAFLASQPAYPLRFLGFGGAVLLLMALLLAVLFPYTRGPYQELQLQESQLQVKERERQQVVTLEALTTIKGVLVSPRARNRPARYALLLLGTDGALLATINANAFETAQLQTLLDHLRAQRPELHVDLAAIATAEIALR